MQVLIIADIDECKDNQNTCDLDNSICVNTYGSYECVCKAGYIFHEEKEGCRGKCLR